MSANDCSEGILNTVFAEAHVDELKQWLSDLNNGTMKPIEYAQLVQLAWDSYFDTWEY